MEERESALPKLYKEWEKAEKKVKAAREVQCCGVLKKDSMLSPLVFFLAFLRNILSLPHLLYVLMQLEGLGDKIEELECMFAWRLVLNQEEKLKRIEESLEQNEKKKQENAQQQKQILEEKQLKQQEVEQSEDSLKGFDKMIKDLNGRQRDIKDRKRQFVQQRKRAKNEIAVQKRAITNAESNIKRLQTKLTALVKKSAAHRASNANQMRQMQIDAEQEVHLAIEISTETCNTLTSAFPVRDASFFHGFLLFI